MGMPYALCLLQPSHRTRRKCPAGPARRRARVMGFLSPARSELRQPRRYPSGVRPRHYSHNRAPGLARSWVLVFRRTQANQVRHAIHMATRAIASKPAHAARRTLSCNRQGPTFPTHVSPYGSSQAILKYKAKESTEPIAVAKPIMMTTSRPPSDPSSASELRARPLKVMNILPFGVPSSRPESLEVASATPHESPSPGTPQAPGIRRGLFHARSALAE